MKLVLEDFISPDIKDFLLSQEGITDVELSENKYLTILDIKYNKKTTPDIIMKYIELYQENEYSILFEFDKGTTDNFKTLKYIIDDMCCEHCYRGLVMDLFENEKIKSVKSNFDEHNTVFNVEFIIEYDENCLEEDIIEYIKSKYNY